MTTADILNAAADLIENGQWILDDSVIQADVDAIAWTVSGAISRVAPDLKSALEAIASLSRFLKLDGVSSWERQIGRTTVDVVDSLREAAEQTS